MMFALLRAADLVQGKLESALGDVGLSMAKFSVLSQLAAEREPIALCELANRLSCVRSNVTQLIDRLEADGLVTRVADPQDRRSVRAALTTLGSERYSAGQIEVERVQREFVGRLGSEDSDHLLKALEAIQ
jgi:DNA-binding MarR family transcriptional regulator